MFPVGPSYIWRTLRSIVHENEKLRHICELMFSTAGLLRPVIAREGHSQSPSLEFLFCLDYHWLSDVLISEAVWLERLFWLPLLCRQSILVGEGQGILNWRMPILCHAPWGQVSGDDSISFFRLLIAGGTVDLASRPCWWPSSIPILPVRRLTNNCLFAEYKTSEYRFQPLSALWNDKIS